VSGLSERFEERADDGFHATFECLENDVAGEAVGDAHIDVVAHHVAAFDIADEIQAGRSGEQWMSFLAQGVAFAGLFTN
jgi:hypothetical protein